jgi:hypothetical protein
LNSSEPINARDASQIAAGGCILGAPLALAALARWALKSAEAREHAMSHQVEEVELHGTLADASVVPAEESLNRFITSLRRTIEPFEKMGARFEQANYDSEMQKLENVKKRFAAEGAPPGPEAEKLLREAEQTLARYAPPR